MGIFAPALTDAANRRRVSWFFPEQSQKREQRAPY
jgi:hypothetical protein